IHAGRVAWRRRVIDRGSRRDDSSLCGWLTTGRGSRPCEVVGGDRESGRPGGGYQAGVGWGLRLFLKKLTDTWRFDCVALSAKFFYFAWTATRVTSSSCLEPL